LGTEDPFSFFFFSFFFFGNVRTAFFPLLPFLRKYIKSSIHYAGKKGWVQSGRYNTIFYTPFAHFTAPSLSHTQTPTCPRSNVVFFFPLKSFHQRRITFSEEGLQPTMRTLNPTRGTWKAKETERDKLIDNND